MVHIGIYALNPKPLKNSHDRTYRSHRLAHFSQTNLRTTRHDQDRRHSFANGEIVEGRDYFKMTTVGEAVLAMHNYVQVQRACHPLDPGPVAMFTVILKLFIAGQLRNVSHVALYFKTIVDENADSASRGELC